METYELGTSRWAEELPVQPYESDGKRIITKAKSFEEALFRFNRFAEQNRIHNGGEITAIKLESCPEELYTRI